MIFMHPQEPNFLRKILSYILIGAGVAILLLPTLIGFLLVFSGCILLNKIATNYVVMIYQKAVHSLLKRK